MKKFKSALTLLSIAAVITALTITVGNTLTTRTEKQLALKTNQAILQKPTPTPIATKKPMPTPTLLPTKEPLLTPSPAPTPTPLTVILPVTGAEVVGEFTDEMPVFQATYGDYRTHLGIDFANEKNSPVYAVADGIVTQNYFDYEQGYTVEIDHGDGLCSLYRNLSGDHIVQVGQVAKQGDLIGTMGDSGIWETHLSHHLHFELQKDGTPVNPTTYFGRSLETP